MLLSAEVLPVDGNLEICASAAGGWLGIVAFCAGTGTRGAMYATGAFGIDQAAPGTSIRNVSTRQGRSARVGRAHRTWTGGDVLTRIWGVHEQQLSQKWWWSVRAREKRMCGRGEEGRKGLGGKMKGR
eukprot:2603633-Rhodomonas_salina.6